MLHILRQTPAQIGQSALWALLQADDVMLLLQDGVFCGQSQSLVADRLFSSTVAIYALQADVAARGLGHSLASQIEIIDYPQFVQLTLQHPQQMYW